MSLNNICQVLFSQAGEGLTNLRSSLSSKTGGVFSVTLCSLTETSYLGNIWFSWQHRHFSVLQCPLLYHIPLTLLPTTASTICFSEKCFISQQEWLPAMLTIGKVLQNHKHLLIPNTDTDLQCKHELALWMLASHKAPGPECILQEWLK